MHFLTEGVLVLEPDEFMNSLEYSVVRFRDHLNEHNPSRRPAILGTRIVLW